MKSKSLIIIVSVFLLVCCKVDNSKKNLAVKNDQDEISYSETKNDSLLIEELVRKVYKWNEKSSNTYFFNIGIEDEKKDKYIGVDWEVFMENSRLLKNSGLFSDIFISNYKETLKQIDKKVKNKEYEYDWLVGEYPPFGTDANEWCHCQDIPSANYWNNIEIGDIKKIRSNIVSLTWNWGKNNKSNNDFNYPVKVKKEGGIWKIIYLDGFDNKYF